MKNYLLILALLTSLLTFNSHSQCEIVANASPLEIFCGQTSTLSAYGFGEGTVVLSEEFTTGFGPGWSGTPGATSFSNPCSPNGVDGTPHAWMDGNTSVPRTLTSASFNLTTATAGVTICFDLLFATQNGNSPCEGPDEPDEGVYFQYSTDGGATWITINYFDPEGGYDTPYTSWNNWCFQIPTAALTANTMFRWHQTADSGAEFDHWGIDNVQIVQNDINAEVLWEHDNYSYGVGSPGGVNPNVVTPTSTTTYSVTITTQSGQECTADVTVVVLDPVYEVNLTTDPTPATVCPGECVEITGEAIQVLDPGGIETYENNEFEVVVSSSTDININVQGINTNTIYDGLIQNVTLNGFNFSGTFFCTSFGGCNCNGTTINFGSTCTINTSGFTVTLTSPGGCTIILAPANVANGNYNNTVFVPIGGTAIGGGFPTGGPWQPNQPFSTLNGCDPNGTWTLSVSSPGFGFGLGTFSGWSITFDDPPIHEPVTTTWSPTAGLSHPNQLDTDACPTTSTNYTLTVGNGTTGCPTHTETVAITVAPCDGCIPPIINLTALSTCSPNTVNLSNAILPSSDAATLTFYATQNDALNGTNPLPSSEVATAGTYWVRAELPTDALCFGVHSIVVNATPQEDASFTFNNFCIGTPNGPTNIQTAGGTFSFNPIPTDGATINPSTGVISNATANGSYTVTYSTNGTCVATATNTLSVSSITATSTATGENCGNSDGSITLTASSGTLPYMYTLNGGAPQASNTFSNLTSGNYQITVTDNAGCSTTLNAVVPNIGGPSIDDFTVTNPSCPGLCDGSILVEVTGGILPYTYVWRDAQNNIVGTNSATLDGMCSDNYTVTITDAGGATILNSNTSFENGAGTPCGCPTSYNCVNDAGQVFDGQHPIYTTSSTGCVTSTTSFTSPLGANSGNGYLYFYAGLDRMDTGPYTFTGGETVELCIFYSGPQGAGPAGQNTTNSHFSFGLNGVQIGPDIPVPTNTGWTQFCYTHTMPAGNHTFNIMTGGAAQYAMWFDDFTITSGTGASCPATANYTLIEPTGQDATFTLTDFCENANNTASNIATPGGTFTFNPVPTDGATINQSTGEIANGVGGATYTVSYIIGGAACSNTHNETVTVHDLPQPSITGDLTYCDENGVTLDAGDNYADYNWSNGLNTQVINALEQTGLAITVTDINGCIGTSATVDILRINLTLDVIATTNPDCDVANGSIEVLATGVAGPFSYLLDGQVQSNDGTFTNLGAGTYTITVQDISGVCTASSIVTLSNTTGPSISLIGNSNADCGANNGAIVVEATGGNAPYSYTLNGQENNTDGIFANLSPGDYTIVVEDAIGGCTATITATIIENTGPLVTNVASTNLTCSEDLNGSISINATSQSAINYELQDGNGNTLANNPTGIFNNLGTGTYTITISDASICTSNEIVTITSPQPLVSNTTATNESCLNACDGTISWITEGGTIPYTYEVNNIPTTSTNLSDLCPGTYTINLVDANGCIANSTATILDGNNASIPNYTMTPDGCSADCDGSVIATIPSGVSYTLNDITNTTGIFTELCGGPYKLTIETAAGCITSIAIHVEELVTPHVNFGFNPLEPTIFDPNVQVNNYSSNATDYVWEITSEFPPYFFSTTVESFSHLFPHTPSTYQVCLTATNELGCTATACKELVVNDEMVLFVPNTFTPDGDEFNQHLQFYTNGVDKYDFEFLIFNRWGELIFETHDPAIGWDGTYKGKLVQNGTYSWILIAKDKRVDYRKEMSGHVNVLK